jgi:hypothetical protein
MWEFWYVREASTAIYVANMPMCWALMRRLFNLRAFNGISSSNGARSRSKSIPITATASGMGSRLGIKNKSFGGTTSAASRTDTADRGGGNTSWWDREPGLARTESEEYIVGNSNTNVPLEILTLREVEVDRGSLRDPIGGGTRSHVQSSAKMFDGSGRDYETRTTVTTVTLGRKSESGS